MLVKPKSAIALPSSVTRTSSSHSHASKGFSRVLRTPLLSACGSVPISVRMAVRVLVVDDHPLTRSALGGLLEQNAFAVVGEAADGDEAVDRARDLQPDLVLLDLS